MAHQISDVEIEEEEEYDENVDEDFNPESAGAADGEASSSSEDDEPASATTKQPKKSKKRKSEAVDGLDSGDEATIQERRKKKRKGGKDEEKDPEDEDSGGEGRLIKTRAQRLAEKVERKQRKRARVGDVTIDVDQLWADLSSRPIGRASYILPTADGEDMDVDATEQNKENAPEQQKPPDDADEVITITRRIEYAGQITEVQEQVPRSSKEAQTYLAQHPEADPNYKPPASDSTLTRPLKRPSIFEPNPLSVVKGVPPEKLRPRAPTRTDVLMAAKRAEEKQKAEKLSTVQKSALDWRGFVETAGLRGELDEYGKSKGGYLAREEFLGRAQGVREGRAREARLRG